MRCAFTLIAALAGLAAATSVHAAPLELRFCGTGPLRTYPLSAEAGPLEGLLLHDLAIVNRSGAKLEVTGVELGLLQGGRVVETRALAGDDLAGFGAFSRQIEAIPLAKGALDLICGDHRLVPQGAALAGPALAPDQAMLVTDQVFAFSGARDVLRVTVSAGGERQSVDLPIASGMAGPPIRFPVKGVWVVKSGPSFQTHHRWALPSEFALDLVKAGPDGRSHSGDGTEFSDYYAYGQPVFAAASGRVVRAVDGRPEPTDLLRRPGEDAQAFSQRIAGYEQTLFAAGVDGVTGNHLIIDQGGGIYALYAHLKPGSLKVRAGDIVAAGAEIAALGGSGNALVEPHLHFQLCDQPTPLACTGLPAAFSNIELPYLSFAARPVQSGDIVITK